MAVAVEMDFKGGSLAQYDRVIQGMGFTPGGKGAPGGLFHWVAETPDGIRVVDVWSTRAAFDAFAAEKIGPLTQGAGLPPPAMRFTEIYNYLTAG